MKLPDINLDDRTYTQLVEESIALIAKHYPKWTDYNPSDPGITLLELFSYLTESAFYQMNIIPDKSYENFTKLLGVKKEIGDTPQSLLYKASSKLKEQTRLITLNDFEE